MTGEEIPHIDLPLNLPHAARLAGRLAYHVSRVTKNAPPPLAMSKLHELLLPMELNEDNPSKEEAEPIVKEAAELARAIVQSIEEKKVGDDRLGQIVRNFFECLALGKEGAEISLRAGENPDSLLRPR